MLKSPANFEPFFRTFCRRKVDLLSVSAGLLCSYDFIIGQFLVWSIRGWLGGSIPSQPFVNWAQLNLIECPAALADNYLTAGPRAIRNITPRTHRPQFITFTVSVDNLTVCRDPGHIQLSTRTQRIDFWIVCLRWLLVGQDFHCAKLEKEGAGAATGTLLSVWPLISPQPPDPPLL